MKYQNLSLYINGENVETEKYLPVFHKFTGEKIAEISKAERQDVTRAVSSAEDVFKNNPLTPYRRYEILLKASELMKEDRESFEQLLIEEVGKTKKDAIGELDRTISTLLISAEEAKKISGEMVPLEGQENSENKLGFTIRVPKGVIGAITPFNYPLLLGTHKIAPALAAGNTIVVKPATTTPISTFKLVELLEKAGLPKGYVNIITGSGAEVGEWLLDEEKIKMYTFTGSAEVGLHIKNRSGMRTVALELGNNSPNIIHFDADIKKAAQLTSARSFHNAGQACISVQRLYVHEDVLQEFTDEYMNHVNHLKVGDPEDPSTDVGPMISEREAMRAEEWVQEAISEGAVALSEVKREKALFYPVVLSNVQHEMKVVCMEVFAPIVSIIPYSDFDEVIKSANNTEYGLQAGIFTNNMSLAMKAAKSLEFGGVIVNDVSTYRSDIMPYGGVKNSGLGKEGPKYTIEEMTEERMIVINY